MDIFVEPAELTDPDDILALAVTAVRLTYPDWEPGEAEFIMLAFGAIAQMAAVSAEVRARVPAAIFRWAGANLYNLPPDDATPATVDSTWTMKDNAGYTIPANTAVVIQGAGDQSIGFQVTMEVVVPAGQVATAAGEVPLEAINVGASGSGLAGPATLSDSLDFVTAIAMVGPTSGGQDAEADDHYLNRLSQRLELMTDTPILARDFALIAMTIMARATGIDNYDPVTDTSNNEKMVAIAGMDAAGANYSQAIKDQVKTLLESLRETNFVVNVIDPTRTTIDVDYEGVAHRDWDPADVETRVNQALADYLNPFTWGATDPSGEQPEWNNVTIVRYTELVTVVNNVDGFDYLTSLTIRTGANAFDVVDINLPGPAPLPQLGVVTGLVNAP